jgi:hypothetical protein
VRGVAGVQESRQHDQWPSGICGLLFFDGLRRSGVLSKPALLLRIEGGFDLALSLIFYQAIDANWLLFVLLLLAPDIAIVGYLRGVQVGTICYNLVHTLVGPFLLIAYAYLTSSPWLLPYALIWTAHIGADRMLGFGLKYPAGFRNTHLGEMKNRGV